MNAINKIYLCYTKPILSATEEPFLTSKFLSADELHSADTMKDENQRCAYIQSHAFKRKILSTYLNVPCANIKFYTNQYGKPFLVKQMDEAPLFFNLSHTSGITALIVSSYENTGIDIEKVTDRKDITLLQNILLNPAETKETSHIVDYNLQKANFFRVWVIKECFLKAFGLGFTLEPSLIEIENLDGNSFQVKADHGITNHFALIQYQQVSDFALAYTNPFGESCCIETFTFDIDFVMLQ